MTQSPLFYLTPFVLSAILKCHSQNCKFQQKLNEIRNFRAIEMNTLSGKIVSFYLVYVSTLKNYWHMSRYNKFECRI